MSPTPKTTFFLVLTRWEHFRQSRARRRSSAMAVALSDAVTTVADGSLRAGGGETGSPSAALPSGIGGGTGEGGGAWFHCSKAPDWRLTNRAPAALSES